VARSGGRQRTDLHITMKAQVITMRISRLSRLEGNWMTAKSQIASERREGQRFGISAPLTVLIGKRSVPGFTQNLSNRGVFFHLNQADSSQIGGVFEFTVELPPEITLTTRCLVECQGRVVRTERVSGQMTGIAAEILHYSIQREPAACAWSLRMPRTRWSASQLFCT
jgi:hypothetical protein